MGYKNSEYKHEDKASTDIAFTQDVSIAMRHHQVAVETSTIPAAGTLAVQGLPVGATKYVTLGTLDLTDEDDRLVKFEGWFTSLRFVPASITAGVTYSVFGYSVRGDK